MSHNSIPTEILNTLDHVDDENLDTRRSKSHEPGEESRFRANEVKNKSRAEIPQAQAAGGNTRKQPAAQKKEHFVDRHRVELISRVSNINPILDQLLKKEVLQQEQYDQVRVIRPTQEQMRFLYSGPLKASKKSKDVFLSALKKEERYLIQDLTGESSTKAHLTNDCTTEPGPSTKPSTKGPKKSENVKPVLQYGKYEGKTFKWLLKNDSSFVVSVVGDYQQQTEDGKSRILYKENKEALKEFVTQFPEVVQQVNIYRGLTPLGFGKYKDVTHQALYNSTDKDKQSYVDYLRREKKTVTKGSPMEAAINYVLRCDKERSFAPFTSANLQKRKSTKKRSNPGTKSKPVAKKEKLK